MDARSFFHTNGTILRILNAVRGSRCGLKSIEILFTGRIGHRDFLDCIRYLSGKEYIKFCGFEGGEIADFAEFDMTDILLSDAGIKVLRGEILDKFVEV